jgi:hypothetical protein
MVTKPVPYSTGLRQINAKSGTDFCLCPANFDVTITEKCVPLLFLLSSFDTED